jgi:GR25 family glycosyltransferase involved in LPS biosynthesis
MGRRPTLAMKHYYINLEKRIDRKENTEQLFEKLDVSDFERINAVDGTLVDYQKVLDNKMAVNSRWLDPIEDRPLTPGEVGCTLSHITAWSKIVTSGKPGIIIEDDLYHSTDNYNITQISERLDEFDLVYLSMDNNAQGFDDLFEIPGYCYWTAAYALSVQGASKLLNNVAVKNIIPADEYLPMMLGTSPHADLYPEFKDLPKLKGLAYKNNIFTPHKRETSIGKTDTENNLRFKEWKDFRLFTVATESKKAEQLIKSCEIHNLHLEMLGVGEKWQGGVMADGPGGGHKVHYLRSRLRNVDDRDIVMFVDGYDVVINDEETELVNRFKQFGADVVFGAEPLIWPDNSIAEQFPQVHTRNRFLNSGGFIGKASVIKEMLRTDINKADDDQLYYQKLFLSGNWNIKLDVENYIFQCVSGTANSLSVSDNNQVYNEETGCYSCVLHGNGGDEDKKAYQSLVNQLFNRGAVVPINFARYHKIWTVADDIVACEYLTPQMCDDIIGACDELGGWEPRPDDAYPAQEIRIQKLCPNLYKEMEKNLTKHVWPQLEAYWPPMSMYGIRDYFAMRYSLDTQTSLNLHNDASMVSGSVKLNEDYQGAELTFPRQHFTNRHVPRGVMLLWPGQVTHPHVCEELEEGVKYSLTLWTKRFTQDS